MFTQQSAMATTGHNLANINTEGYSRQKVRTQSEQPGNDGTGGGVKRGVPQRVFDRFTSSKIVQEQSNSGIYSERQKFLNKIEIIFNEIDNTGLRNELNEFWNAWSFLANEPESSVAREQLVEQSDALTTKFRNMHGELRTLRSEANSRVAGVVAEINGIVAQIADLNRQISSFETTNRVANDARDQRQLLLEELAGKVDVQWLENDKGEFKVSVGTTGWTLVEGRNARQLRASLLGGETGMHHVKGIGENDYRVDLTNEFRAGELQEALMLRDKVIVDYMDQLDDLAFNLAQDVNRHHATGTGLNSGFERVKSAYGLNEDAQFQPMPFLKDGTMQLHLLDTEGNFLETYEVGVQAGVDTLHDIVDRINETIQGPLVVESTEEMQSVPTEAQEDFDVMAEDLFVPLSLRAQVEDDGSVSFQAGEGRRFIFGEDTSEMTLVMGLNHFFRTLKGAEDIQLSDRVMAEPNQVSTGKDLVPGDNQVALSIAQLQTTPTMQDDTMTFDEFYNGILADVGLRIERTQIEKEHQDNLLAQFQAIRDSVSSVNMDEEVTDLVQYQKAYEASAKFVSTVDQMMETVIQM